MATIHGSITGVSLLNANGARKAYLVSVNFGTYTASSDDADVASVGAAIASHTRNGKTNTLRSAVCIGAGKTSAGADVYMSGSSVQALTVSSDTLTGNLTDAAGAEGNKDASVGVQLCVVVDES